MGEWLNNLWNIHTSTKWTINITTWQEKGINSHYALNNMSESQMHYDEWKNPATNGSILYNIIYMIFWNKQNHKDGVQISDINNVRGGKVFTKRQHKGIFFWWWNCRSFLLWLWLQKSVCVKLIEKCAKKIFNSMYLIIVRRNYTGITIHN